MTHRIKATLPFALLGAVMCASAFNARADEMPASASGAPVKGSVHRIVNRPDGTAVADSRPAPAFSPADFQGRPVDGWTMFALEGAGLDCLTFIVKPGAELFPIHEGDDPWFGYVIRGSVESILTDKEKANTGVVRLNAGDYLFFDPKTMHGWKSCGVEAELMFLRIAPPSTAGKSPRAGAAAGK